MTGNLVPAAPDGTGHTGQAFDLLSRQTLLLVVIIVIIFIFAPLVVVVVLFIIGIISCFVNFVLVLDVIANIVIVINAIAIIVNIFIIYVNIIDQIQRVAFGSFELCQSSEISVKFICSHQRKFLYWYWSFHTKVNGVPVLRLLPFLRVLDVGIRKISLGKKGKIWVLTHRVLE